MTAPRDNQRRGLRALARDVWNVVTSPLPAVDSARCVDCDQRQRRLAALRSGDGQVEARVRPDGHAATVYLRLNDRVTQRTHLAGPNVMIDRDVDNEVVGLESLGVREIWVDGVGIWSLRERRALRDALEILDDLRDATSCDVRVQTSGTGQVCAQHGYVVDLHREGRDDERCPHARARELLVEFAPRGATEGER